MYTIFKTILTNNEVYANTIIFTLLSSLLALAKGIVDAFRKNNHPFKCSYIYDLLLAKVKNKDLGLCYILQNHLRIICAASIQCFIHSKVAALSYG